MKKRFFLFLVLGLITLVIILAGLPTIVSTDTVKDQAIQAINKRIPGRLSIAQWSLHWFGGIQCEGLGYEDKNRGLSVQIDQIILSKGLMALIFNYRKPGRIEILNPHTVIQLPEKDKTVGDTGSDEKLPPGKATSPVGRTIPSDDMNKPSRKKVTPFTLPPIVADLKITGGDIVVVYSEKKEEVVAKDLILNINIDEPGKPLLYRLLARAGQGTGRISGQGSLVIPLEGIVTMDQIRSDANLTITDWDIAPVLAIVSAVSGSPMGEGQLNGQFQIQGDIASGIQLTGQLVGTDVRLAGDGLKGDTPFVKKITCDIDAVQIDNELALNRLVFDSSMGRGSVNGRLNNLGESRFQTETDLNLAEIFSQLPNTLNLKPGTKITDGVVALKATVTSDDRTTRFDGKLFLDRLAGISGKKRLVWNEPLEAYAAGSYGDDGMRLDNFKVQSSFLAGEGQGDLDNLQIRLKADIRAALKEVNKFIDTKGWKAAGQMNLTLNGGTRPEKAHFVEADLDIDGFQLHRQKQVIVPKNRFISRLKTDFKLDGKSRLSALSQTSIDLNTWLGKTQVQMDRLVLDPDGKPSLVRKFSTKGEYNLKLLSTLIRAFKRIPADTSVSGKAKMDAVGHFDGKTITLETAILGAKDFTCRIQGKKMNYNQVRLTSQGTLRPEGRSIDLAFLEINADKDRIRFSPLRSADWAKLASSLTAQVTADLNLTKARTVLGDIVPESLYPRDRVRLDMAVEKAVGSPGTVTGKVESRDFVLGKKGASPKPHLLNIRYKGQYTTDQTGKIQELLDTSLDYDAWLGKGRIGLKKIEWSGGKDLPRLQALVYEGTLALRPLAQLLHGLNVLPGDTNLSGHADIHTLLSSEKRTITFKDTTINVNEFIYHQAKRRFQDKQVSLHAKGHVNLKDRSASLIPLEIKTTAGNIAFPELSINDWADLIHAVKGNGTAKLDLTALATSLGNYLNLPAETRIAGKAEIEVKTDLVAAKKQTLSLNCSFEPIKIDSAKKSILAEDQVTLGVELAGDLANKNLTIKQMVLMAKALSINAAGRMSPQGKEHLVTADGDLAVDLERLQDPLNELLGTDIILSGKSKRPFSVRIETKNGKWQDLYSHTDLMAALHADRINGFGMELKSIDMPVNIEKASARINISGKANEGELALQPTIHLATKPPVLSLPDDSKILNGAKITKEMANELLTLIHPIFKGTTAVQGTVDLVMHQMSWPLAASARKDARFKGILKFKDVRVNAEGLIYDLLTAMRVEERDVFLEERTVEFSGRDGRIRCSPLRISVKGYRMEVGGTMGFDGSLDYTAKIPITLEMVGEKVYPYAKETSLEIPIGGTVSHPKLNLDSLKTMVQKMIQQTSSRVLEEKAGELLKKIFN